VIIACVVLAYDMSENKASWFGRWRIKVRKLLEQRDFSSQLLCSVFSASLFFGVHCTQLSVQSTSVGSIWNRDRQTDKS
jgi:hypothetical protein